MAVYSLSIRGEVCVSVFPKLRRNADQGTGSFPAQELHHLRSCQHPTASHTRAENVPVPLTLVGTFIACITHTRRRTVPHVRSVQRIAKCVICAAPTPRRATHPRARERLAMPPEDLSLVTFHRGLETRATACHRVPI